MPTSAPHSLPCTVPPESDGVAVAASESIAGRRHAHLDNLVGLDCRAAARHSLLFLLPGIDYMPGLIGLNNMRQNDYANVIVQALMRILPIRYAWGQLLWLRVKDTYP